MLVGVIVQVACDVLRSHDGLAPEHRQGALGLAEAAIVAHVGANLGRGTSVPQLFGQGHSLCGHAASCSAACLNENKATQPVLGHAIVRNSHGGDRGSSPSLAKGAPQHSFRQCITKELRSTSLTISLARHAHSRSSKCLDIASRAHGMAAYRFRST